MDNDINNINDKLDNIVSRIKTIDKLITVIYIVSLIIFSMVLSLVLTI